VDCHNIFKELMVNYKMVVDENVELLEGLLGSVDFAVLSTTQESGCDDYCSIDKQCKNCYCDYICECEGIDCAWDGH